jgi:ribosomal protein S21
MSSNCKVVLRYDSQLSDKQNFENMLHVFNKRVGEYGIIPLCKRYEYYESKSQKIKRKKKEAILRRLKEESEKPKRREYEPAKN